MTSLRFHDGQAHITASEEEPYPVRIDQSRSTVGTRDKYLKYGPLIIPGITAADALDADDQMGTVLRFDNIPATGSITEMFFHDLDNEGINKFVWVFDREPTLAASDAAFAVADSDLDHLVGVFEFQTWRTNANNQMGMTPNTPCDFVIGGNSLWMAVKTSGADNIAAGSMPKISFVVKVAQ